MTFSFRPMAQAEAEAVASWHYPEPFSFYDWTADADDLAELLDPALRGDAYFAVGNESGDLVGYYSFKQEEPGTLVIGLGLRPDLTGRGLGAAFVVAGLDYARERFPAEEFSLAVAAFNQRAIKVYERVGFEPVRIYMHRTNGADWEFVEMRRTAGGA
jgi:[ribosomal protein S18]-alanine N-acetyltransferase